MPMGGGNVSLPRQCLSLLSALCHLVPACPCHPTPTLPSQHACPKHLALAPCLPQPFAYYIPHCLPALLPCPNLALHAFFPCEAGTGTWAGTGRKRLLCLTGRSFGAGSSACQPGGQVVAVFCLVPASLAHCSLPPHTPPLPRFQTVTPPPHACPFWFSTHPSHSTTHTTLPFPMPPPTHLTPLPGLVSSSSACKGLLPPLAFSHSLLYHSFACLPRLTTPFTCHQTLTALALWFPRCFTSYHPSCGSMHALYHHTPPAFFPSGHYLHTPAPQPPQPCPPLPSHTQTGQF